MRGKKLGLICILFFAFMCSTLNVSAKENYRIIKNKYEFVKYASAGLRKRKCVTKLVSEKPIKNQNSLLNKAKSRKFKHNSFAGDYCKENIIDCVVIDEVTQDDRYKYLYSVIGYYYETRKERDYVQKRSNEIVRCLKGKSDYYKLYYISDWIVNNISYLSGNNTAYKTLKTGRGNCKGYALLFQKLAVKVGLDSRIVRGYTRHSDGELFYHAWNIVKLSGKWYYIDTTYMDNTFKDMDYFLFGENYCSKYRTVERDSYSRSIRVEKEGYLEKIYNTRNTCYVVNVG